MSYLPLIYAATFLFLSVAISMIFGLEKGIGIELRRRKKAGAMKLRKRTLLIKLTKLKQKRLQLIEDLKISQTVYWLSTAFGATGGAAIGKLHSSMLILSNSYLVTEDILKSVQDNIDVLEYPAPFRDFLTYVSLIDSNIKTGLRRMELQVDNLYFSQWIDVLIMAQDDRSLKYVTMSVIDAMNDVRQAQRESDTALYVIWREYLTVLILIFSAPLIFRILMKQAFTVLITTLPGQALLVLLLAAVVFSLVKAVKLNKPLLM